MAAIRSGSIVRGLAAALIVVAPGLILAQAIPPPGVDAARPPTERTLRPVDRSQTRERVRTSRDCRKEEADLRAQYRIQSDGVHSQYDARIAAASGAARESLQSERDAKLATLHGEADAAAKKFRDKCHDDNEALLRSPLIPGDRN
jgi:hypothetical protein